MLFTVPQNFEFVKYFFQSFLTSLAALRSSNFFSLPHSEAFVKNFFQKFLKLASVISAATILGYHILWLLSSVFFISLCGAVLTAPTALLEYQIIPRLSTPFFNFLRFFIFPCIFKAAALSYLSFNIYYSAVLISPSCFPSLHLYRKSAGFPAPFLSQQQRLQLFSTERSIYRLRDLCEVRDQRAGLEHRVVLSKRNKVVMFTYQ